MNTAFSAQLPPKALARVKMHARRRKARRIRRTVVAFTVAAFIAAWLGIYVQMVEGKDPGLSTSTHHATKQVTHTSGAKSRASTSSSSSSSASSGSSGNSTPSPVTTSQS